MDHQAQLKQACTLYLTWLAEQAAPAPLAEAHGAEVLNSGRTWIDKQGDAALREHLTTLSTVLLAFSQGRASRDSLLYYLAEQFDTLPEELPAAWQAWLDTVGNASVGVKDILPGLNPADYPKVSVIITTYNRKDFLSKAVQSILGQDYPNKEITVIDDCSTDGTAELMEQRFGADPRVIFMRSETNSGPGNNRRKAFAAHADGEFVHFLDDDDYLVDMNYYSKAVRFHLQHPGLSFVAANVFMQYSQSRKLDVSSLGLAPVIDKRVYFMNFEQQGYPKPASTLTTLFRREALMEMDILGMNMVNDASIYLRSLLIGDAGFIDVIAGVYRVHGNNITFHLSQDFLIENLEEKRLIRGKAIDQYGYSPKEMNEWFNHNVYDTIFYYLMNSAKSHTDFKSMYTWAAKHSPPSYSRLKSQFRVKLFKKQLLRVSLLRSLLGK
ncbi:glycosyltransferase family 2 protein [Paenibacillus donghaensis]|uniref:Glycosyltransferase 2-like domain-containing protein n=1 Tax=Paenibacillus donghaensis TaxID=414771 RepID=A0A2Z2KG94_9BACL|nr:glycosyltransferase family 2 protein [Paenibacillus donghaensis]ASA25194.1 hypothetical protein B9T62_33360 [Paenibacillus donghaensis]